MSRLKGVLMAVSFAIAALYGCSKTGNTGATGATGTANVMYSTWAVLSMTYNAGDSTFEQTIAADSITQAVLDSGIVLSYIKYSNSSNEVQVENAANYMEEVYGLKSISLYSSNYDYTGVSFRYVVVHGGTGISSGRLSAASNLLQGYTKAEWQSMPYKKAMAILGKN